MRNNLGIGLLAGALAAVACGTSSKTGIGSHPGVDGTGASGNGTGNVAGAGFVSNAGGPSIKVPDPNGTGGVGNVDPGNPNITHAKCTAGTCTDFSATPIMGMGVPDNAASLFGSDPTVFAAGSLCALEPQLGPNGTGAMMPANWVRPRFRVMAPAGIDLLEIRIKSPAEANELVAYTTYSVDAKGNPSSWYMPKDIWTGVTDATSQASGTGFANNAAGQPVTVTIRGVNSKVPGSMPVGIQGDFNIAPVVATGSMVFWTVNSGNVTPDSSKLLGFAVGDEGVANALSLTQVQWTGELGEDGAVLRGYYDKTPLAGFTDGQVRCIGCHATIPDGTGVVFGDDWPWSVAAAALTTGAIPTAFTAGAQGIMKAPWWGQETMSKSHWTAGDKIIVTSYGTTFLKGEARTKGWNALPSYNGTDGATVDDKVKYHSLAWINAEYSGAVPTTITGTTDYGADQDAKNTAFETAKGTGWGLIATGDTGVSDVSPALSHDGKTIVYVTTDNSPDGHPDATATKADIRTVPYNEKAGGTSTALAGASDPSLLEYYPSFSGDDKLIAFTQAPLGPDGPYYNRNGKVMVIPVGGGTAVPLAANTPNTCAGDATPGSVINSWPKWSPDVFTTIADGKTYYFLVFSSGRKYGDEFSTQFDLPKNTLSSFTGLNTSSQLYLAAVVVDAMGGVTSYPAVYIWNQNRTPGAGGTATSLNYSNLTPAWDPIALPPLDIPPVPTDMPPK